MATENSFALKGQGRDSYRDLVVAFPLSSIRSDEHLTEAQKIMDRLRAKGTLDDGAVTCRAVSVLACNL